MGTFTMHNGDLLNSTADVIAHQVNCLGKMGAGVAKDIRDKWPDVYISYQDYCKRAENPQDLLGKVLLLPIGQGDVFSRVVANLFGQLSTRNNTYVGRVTDYTALESAMRKTLALMKAYGYKSIAMPYKIGCGLGGGDWDKVEEIIHRVFDDTDIEVELWML